MEGQYSGQSCRWLVASFVMHAMQAVCQGAPLTGPIAVGAMANMWLLLLWQIQALDAGKLHNCPSF